ncbi:MAG: response regulator [Chitinispirillaceae bacterium]
MHTLLAMASTFHVLIIDDEENIRRALGRSLSKLGCVVNMAQTAERGLELLDTERFDAVFAALCVRESGGRGVARFVKQHYPDTKVFLVTGWKGELEPSLLQNDGIHEVIHKPLSFSEIRDKVLEQLG